MYYFFNLLKDLSNLKFRNVLIKLFYVFQRISGWGEGEEDRGQRDQLERYFDDLQKSYLKGG